jgi:hypothetical protein
MDMRNEPIFESEGRKGASTLAEFARSGKISEDKVWELIEEGHLAARLVDDAILIMPDQPRFDRISQESGPRKGPEYDAPLRPLPDFAAPVDSRISDQTPDFTADNRDILAFAQDALSRQAELSKELLEAKDELIRLKDERIAFLCDLLSQRDKEIRHLNRSIEELTTLTKFERR